MWLSQCACRYGWLFKCVHDGLCVGVLVRVSRSILWFLTLDVTPAQLAQCGSKRFYNAVLHGCVFTSECLVKVGVILAEVGIKVKVFVWGLNYINLKKEKEKQAEWKFIREINTIFFNILKTRRWYLFSLRDLGSQDLWGSICICQCIIRKDRGPFWQKKDDAHWRRSRL